MIMQIGDRLQDRWEVRKVLRGGQGEVYILYDHQERLTVVAKTPREDAARKEVAAKRFLQEARTWIGLDDHPNIVRAYFVQTINNRPFLFLEYVAGGTLADWIRPCQSVEAGLGFGIQFCRGMEHAYTRGMKVHRDIKPQNCLMTPDGTLKISDFGLVRVYEQDETAPGQGLTRVGSVLGTPMYLAPEQFVNSSGVDVRADIYSAGVMLYEVFSGHVPFKAEPRDAKKWFQLHTFSPVPAIDGPPAVDTPWAEDLNRIISNCMSKNPEGRYANFADLRVELETLYASIVGEPYPPVLMAEQLSLSELCNKAFSLGELGRVDEEAALLETVLETDPSDADEWIQRGAVLARLGRPESANICFAQATLTHQLASGGRGVAARAVVAGSDSRGPGIGSSANSAAGINPFDSLSLVLKPRKAMVVPVNLSADSAAQAAGLVSLARLFVETYRAQEALPYLEKVLTARPDTPEATEALLVQGLAYRALGRLELAMASLDKALAKNRNLPELWLQRGIVLGELRRYPQAVEALRQANRLEDSPEAWFRLGTLYMETGDPDEALNCYETAARLDPENAEIWSYKGLALAKSGSYSEAMICFSEAERLGDTKAAEAMQRMAALMSNDDLDQQLIHA